MKILDELIRHTLTRRLSQIEYFMKNPGEVQEKILFRLLEDAKNTEWGKKYGYSQIRSYEQFRKNVPISTYEDIYPYIHKMIQGEQNILWHSKIDWFSKSSGTTNARSKFIPVSKESLDTCHFRGGKDVLGLFIENHPQTRFFWGKGLSIGGTFDKHPENPNVNYGDISAVVVQQLPTWAQFLRTPPRKVAMMDKWEDKIDAIVKHTLRQNVTSILGVPTWTIVLIQRILEQTNKQYIEEVWPNLEVFVHGAVSFTPYRDLFKSIAPSLRFMETYNASEGFFGLQDNFSREDMLLMLDYEVFYEFVPLTEIGAEEPQAICLEEVELDKNYAMLISTNAGLWRYQIGDTIKFTSKDPYRIKITGRTKHFINAFGEEVIIENAETAVTHACQQTQAIISNFTAGPLYMEGSKQGGHEWIIEFEKSPDDLPKFIEQLDKRLQEVNSDYEAKRYRSMALNLPVVHPVPEGTFYNWMKKKGKLGGQNKVPRLANNREYLDEILKMLEIEMG
jgi:hypothetical protein